MDPFLVWSGYVYLFAGLIVALVGGVEMGWKWTEPREVDDEA